MIVRKDRQFLVFDFEDGNTVKYDFATKTCIGKKGTPVTNLKSQLRGMTISGLIDCCEDSKYANFLKFIKRKEQNKGRYISNIGTILETVPLYKNFEQFFPLELKILLTIGMATDLLQQ